MKNPVRLIIGSLLLFLALTGMGGGIMLIIDPSGNSIQFPPNLLDGTPFQSYLFPGIILFIFIGIFSLVASVAALSNRNYYPLLAVAEGLLLAGWLSVELMLNAEFYFPALHLPFYFIATLLVILGLSILKIKPLT